MNRFLKTLQSRAGPSGVPICFGLDPVPSRIPGGGPMGDRVASFYLTLLDAMHDAEMLPALVKPNLAWYECLGHPGLEALQRIITACRALDLPILLDAKRGDIGRSSEAYAQALFEAWGADAVTVSPYMGGDSVAPFTQWCARGRGVFILCRTSNPGAADLQDRLAPDRPLYEIVAEHIANDWYAEGIGAVLGATAPQALARAARHLTSSARPVALLLPGIGAQGGSPREVLRTLDAVGFPRWRAIVSASSSIAYAFERTPGSDVGKAAAHALGALARACES